MERFAAFLPRNSTTPRPSNVTGGLLFDLGFYHYGYLYFL